MSIKERGDGTFLIRVYLGRDPVTKKRIEINETIHGSFSKAKKRETDLKAQHYCGRLTKSSRMTVNALFEEYLKSSRHKLELSTYANYKALYALYIEPYIGTFPLDRLKPTHIQQLLNILLDEKGATVVRGYEITAAGRGLSPATVQKVKNVLSVSFNTAVDNRLLSENPASKTKIPLPCDTLANSLTVEEANTFVSVKEEFWYGIAFAFQLHTGLRNQELMALVVDDVDFENKTLRVERACKWHNGVCKKVGKTKTRKSNRVIGLDDQHLALIQLQLERLRGASERRGGIVDGMIDAWVRKERPRQGHLYPRRDLLFPQPNGSIANSSTPRKEFKQMLLRAGVNDGGRNFRWYDLRHTHASVLLTLGFPLHEVADRMGHSVAMLLKMYAHVLRNRHLIAPQQFTDIIST